MIEWTDLIVAGIGLFGVLLGSLITVSRDAWASSRKRRRDGSYAAIRITNILDEYADKCIDVVQDDGTLYGQMARTKDGEEYREARVASPEPLVFPDDIDWRSLKEATMHRVLSLPNLARSTDRHIEVASDFAHPPDYDDFFMARQEGYSRLGVEVLSIGDVLRKEFSIGVKGRAKLGTDWSPENYLEEKVAEFDKRRSLAASDGGQSDT